MGSVNKRLVFTRSDEGDLMRMSIGTPHRGMRFYFL